MHCATWQNGRCNMQGATCIVQLAWSSLQGATCTLHIEFDEPWPHVAWLVCIAWLGSALAWIWLVVHFVFACWLASANSTCATRLQNCTLQDWIFASALLLLLMLCCQRCVRSDNCMNVFMNVNSTVWKYVVNSSLHYWLNAVAMLQERLIIAWNDVIMRVWRPMDG